MRSLRIIVVLLFCGLLVSCGKKPEPPPEPVQTLFDAAYDGDASLARALIQEGRDVNAVNSDGLTPLHIASSGGYSDVVGILLAMEADTAIADRYGFTCLHAAARNGHVELVKMLVDAGADAEAQSKEGLTPLDLAEVAQEDAVVAYLRSLSEPVEEIEPEPVVIEVEREEEAKLLLTGEGFREWTSASGSKVTAEFIECVADVVTLRRNDGEFLRIRINQLSPEDQVAVRAHRDSLPTLSTRTQKVRSSKPRSSTAADIGEQKGWEVITGCRLLRRSGNDGDSFHVQADGKERIFRLYYVDAAETSDVYPDRVEDQSRYFDIDEKDTIKLGWEAKKFTERILSKGSFTVITKWEDALGASSIPRQYAFVVTDHGDLDELLVQAGLARIYGMYVDSSIGSKKESELRKLERAAKREKVGAWGVGKTVAAKPAR